MSSRRLTDADIPKRKGYLTLVGPLNIKTKHGAYLWRYRCDCGTYADIPANELFKRRYCSKNCPFCKADKNELKALRIDIQALVGAGYSYNQIAKIIKMPFYEMMRVVRS